MEIKRILISQKEPAGASPYTDLIAKWGLTVDFHPFFRVEGVSVRDFVAQRVTILDYTAIVFTSRMAHSKNTRGTISTMSQRKASTPLPAQKRRMSRILSQVPVWKSQ